MAIVSICVIVIFTISCIATCSLVNSYEMQQRQKLTKAPNVAIPITILMVVYALAIAAIVYFVWFSTAETFAMALFLVLCSAMVLAGVCSILHEGKSDTDKHSQGVRHD